jgi:hypothetical protein
LKRSLQQKGHPCRPTYADADGTGWRCPEELRATPEKFAEKTAMPAAQTLFCRFFTEN